MLKQRLLKQTLIKRKLKAIGGSIALGALIVAGISTTSSQTQAAALAIEIEFTLSLIANTGSDPLGLDGATVLFRADFADGTTFVDGCCLSTMGPQANAASHSFRISGASVTSTNGVYIDPNGVALFPNFDIVQRDHFYTQKTSDDFILVPGSIGPMTLDALSAVPNASVGDPLTLAYLDINYGSGPFAVLSTTTGSDESRYSYTNVTVRAFEVTPVPLPAAFPLFAAALGLLSFLGWRRKRTAAA